MFDSSHDTLSEKEADTAIQLGLKPDEFELLVRKLGRKPNLVELGIVAAMWSEHCSYKSSRHLLSRFPTSGKCVIQGPGENAGIVDIGDGDVAVFKMESHNHPSFIEPFQGAATGVGGILRDVFAMGARPIALLDALRFGSPEHEKTRSLLAGVVAGISHYANCIGVPTIGGETQFDPGYNGNILVNVMAVGLARREQIFYSRGARAGLSVFYVGAPSGRDGVQGATMASAEFSVDASDNRPSVQVGDPFAEKRLLEACLEMMAEQCVVSIQDMGAAGLSSASAEIASKSQIGMELQLDHVPQREKNMNAYEIMLSESQERMLILPHPETEHRAREICAKWELEAVKIGETTDSRRLCLWHRQRLSCDLPVAILVDDAPLYERPSLPTRAAAPLAAPAPPERPTIALQRLMASPDMCCKRWIWEQYDRHVMADTISASGTANDAAIVRVHGSVKALALCSDSTPRYVAADPHCGGKQAVAEAYRNLVCAGAKPLAFTNNLNFGNPERPEIMGQLSSSIDGMAEAARALDFPVVSGNVSLYNETDGVAIMPTPVVGGLGLIDNIELLRGLTGAQDGDQLLLLGTHKGHLGCSLYLRDIVGVTDNAGPPPPVDLEQELRHANWISAAIKAKSLHGVHDISDGGLACAAIEMALAAGTGVSIRAAGDTANAAGYYFGEDQGCYLLAVAPDQTQILLKNAIEHKIPISHIGAFGGTHASLGEDKISMSVLRSSYQGALDRYMQQSPDRKGGTSQWQ